MAGRPAFTKTRVLLAIRGNPEAKAQPKPKDDAEQLAAMWADDPRGSSYGHVPTIAARLGCSDQTVRNYMQKRDKAGNLTRKAQDIQAAIDQEIEVGRLRRQDFHKQLIRDSEIAQHELVRLLDGPSVRFSLERLDKENYSSRAELTGAEGENLFDDEARKKLGELAVMLEELGRDPSEAMIDTVNAMKSKLLAMKNRGRGDE